LTSLSDRRKREADLDGVHSLCDNCRDDRNPSQSDGDGDGEGDRCDLAWLRSTGIYTQDPLSVGLAEHYCALEVPWVLDPDPPPATAVFYLTTGLYPESDLGQTSGGEARPNTNSCP
jgi:hypothetical protein